MTTQESTDLQALVGGEFTWLGDVLDGLDDEAWDTSSLCEGWRVREVVAHMTQAMRYTPPEFLAELDACGRDFTLLSNSIAERDAGLSTATHLANLRDDAMHAWVPPGGGSMGALSHVVIHGLDITVPLGIARPVPDPAVVAIFEHLAAGGHADFGYELVGRCLRATDVNRSFGSGTPVSGTAADLVLLMSGRKLAAGRIVEGH